MAIIVVGGSSRGAGKTALVCGLIAALSEFRWTAVKVAAHEGGHGHEHGPRTPIWEETVAGDENDTQRYLAAGAARAFLATPMQGGQTTRAEMLPVPDLPSVLDELWPNFGRGTNLIFESNSVVHHVRADVCLMIQAVPQRELPLPERKPSFIAAVGHADAMVAVATTDRFIPDGLSLPGQEPKPIFHLAAMERVSAPMLVWLRGRLGAARS